MSTGMESERERGEGGMEREGMCGRARHRVGLSRGAIAWGVLLPSRRPPTRPRGGVRGSAMEYRHGITGMRRRAQTLLRGAGAREEGQVGGQVTWSRRRRCYHRGCHFPCMTLRARRGGAAAAARGSSEGEGNERFLKSGREREVAGCAREKSRSWVEKRAGNLRGGRGRAPAAEPCRKSRAGRALWARGAAWQGRWAVWRPITGRRRESQRAHQ